MPGLAAAVRCGLIGARVVGRPGRLDRPRAALNGSLKTAPAVQLQAFFCEREHEMRTLNQMLDEEKCLDCVTFGPGFTMLL